MQSVLTLPALHAIKNMILQKAAIKPRCIIYRVNANGEAEVVKINA